MYKKILPAVLVLAFNMTTINAAYADHCYADGFDTHKIVKKLELTADQKTKIETIFAQTDVGVMRDRMALREMRREINAAYIANTMTDEQIDKYVSKKTPLISDILKLKMKERLEISKVLTPDQKAKIASMIGKKLEHEEKKAGE